MRPFRSPVPCAIVVACLTIACADPAGPTAPSRLVPTAPRFGIVDASGTFADGFDFLFNALGGFGTLAGGPWPDHPPTPWKPLDFDVAIHSRDAATWYQPEPFRAMHGTNCAPYQTPEPENAVRPGDTGSHLVSTYDDLNYRCRNHMMTAIRATGYGAIYVTPNAMVDFSAQEASIKFAMSTLRTSAFDWVDLWITPWADNLALPIDMSLALTTDLQGPPRTAIHVRMVPGTRSVSRYEASYVENAIELPLPVIDANGYESILNPVSTRRDTFELRISKTRLRFGMKKLASPDGPAASIAWIDVPLSLPWSQGVVQLGHHSMNPDAGGGSAGTWHWDDLTIAPAVPFTIIATKLTGGTRQRYVDEASESTPVTFERPAPPNSYLRFAAYGWPIQFSVDGGASWTIADKQSSLLDRSDRFRSFWTPIPTGTASVLIRRPGKAAGKANWFVTDIAIWSLSP